MRRMRYLRLTGRQRRLTWLVLAVLLTAGLGCAAVLHMRPIIVSLATARVSNAVNRIVVDAVRDAIDSGQVNYDVLIHLEKDESGRVAALESNMAAFNRLRSQIAGEILRRLSEVSTSELSIPVGTLTGSTLLAGGGLVSGCGCRRWAPPTPACATCLFRRRHQPDQAPDPAACGRIHRHSLCRASPPPPRSATRSPWQRPSSSAPCRETYTYFSTTPDELEDTARDNIMNKG